MKTKFQIVYKLSEQKLEKYYPTENIENAYEDINAYMTENGFVRIEKSIYCSSEKIDMDSVDQVIIGLTKKHPWTNVCITDCKAVEVGNTRSILNDVLKKVEEQNNK